MAYRQKFFFFPPVPVEAALLHNRVKYLKKEEDRIFGVHDVFCKVARAALLLSLSISEGY